MKYLNCDREKSNCSPNIFIARKRQIFPANIFISQISIETSFLSKIFTSRVSKGSMLPSYVSWTMLEIQKMKFFINNFHHSSVKIVKFFLKYYYRSIAVNFFNSSFLGRQKSQISTKYFYYENQ